MSSSGTRAQRQKRNAIYWQSSFWLCLLAGLLLSIPSSVMAQGLGGGTVAVARAVVAVLAVVAQTVTVQEAAGLSSCKLPMVNPPRLPALLRWDSLVVPIQELPHQKQLHLSSRQRIRRSTSGLEIAHRLHPFIESPESLHRCHELHLPNFRSIEILFRLTRSVTAVLGPVSIARGTPRFISSAKTMPNSLRQKPCCSTAICLGSCYSSNKPPA